MPTPKRPTDPDYFRFEFRMSVGGFPRWEGVNKEGSTTHPRTNQLRDAINLRPILSGYSVRGGQSRAATNAASSDLDGMFEATDLGAAVAG